MITFLITGIVVYFVFEIESSDESQSVNYLLALLIPILCTISGKVMDTYIRFNLKYPSLTMALVPGATATICYFLYDESKGNINWYVLVCGWMSTLALCAQPWADRLRSNKIESLEKNVNNKASRALAY